MNRNIPGNKPFHTEEIHVSTEENLLNNLASGVLLNEEDEKRKKVITSLFCLSLI